MARIELAPALDMRAAAPLLAAVRSVRGEDLELDASGVERLGGQCLQVLLAAHRAWAADGHAFRLGEPSTAFKDAWALMGAEALIPLTSSENPKWPLPSSPSTTVEPCATC